MKNIMTETEYNEMVKNGRRGEYPRVLTTDGYKFDQEFHDNHDQWRADNTIIKHISTSDFWPTYREATKLRIQVKKRIEAAAALGSIKSPKKSASSRENGKKGGRPTEKKTYWILSGEGENGTWEKHIATLTGIKRIATKERCGGDRWARIWEEVPETETTEAHIYDIDNGDMRDVPDED